MTDQTETVAFLTRLAGCPPVETHFSFVFIGDDDVWKLKKSVRLPFLDFSALEDRHRFCARELELNAPAAPGLYRGIVPITRGPGGTLALDGTGEIIDWVVRMARCRPFEDILSNVRDGRPSEAQLTEIADTVATYHARLPPILDLVPDMGAIVDGNERSGLAAGLPAEVLSTWRTKMLSRLADRASWLAERARSGFVRRCHGDLHVGNFCLWRDRLVPFDALEFDESLARIDVAYDLAFLLMDLMLRYGRPAANRVLNRYVARTGDAGLLAGLPLFLSMRALIRSHVSARMGSTRSAAAYLAAGMGFLRAAPACVVAVGGLPGTGKSTLARSLAPDLGLAPGALIARSDEIRKRLHGVTPEQNLPPAAYSKEASEAVFANLAAMTRTAASSGHAVIGDATFMTHSQRAMIADAAAFATVPFIGLWLTAPMTELEQRVEARSGDASDATVAVLRDAAAHDPGPGAWFEIDTSDFARAVTVAKARIQSHVVF